MPIAIIVALEWLLAGGGCLFSAAGVGHVEDGANWLELATFGVMGFACLPCIGLIKEILGTEAIFLVGLGRFLCHWCDTIHTGRQTSGLARGVAFVRHGRGGHTLVLRVSLYRTLLPMGRKRSTEMT